MSVFTSGISTVKHWDYPKRNWKFFTANIFIWIYAFTIIWYLNCKTVVHLSVKLLLSKDSIFISGSKKAKQSAVATACCNYTGSACQEHMRYPNPSWLFNKLSVNGSYWENPAVSKQYSLFQLPEIRTDKRINMSSCQGLSSVRHMERKSKFNHGWSTSVLVFWNLNKTPCYQTQYFAPLRICNCRTDTYWCHLAGSCNSSLALAGLVQRGQPLG